MRKGKGGGGRENVYSLINVIVCSALKLMISLLKNLKKKKN